jgi:ABC-type polysaccharide/polyol phosphate export permease
MPLALVLAPLGVAILYVTLIGWSVVIAFACVRYRDIPPMVGALTQFMFFASPILWVPEQLKVGTLLLWLNPVTYLVAIVRDPILGRPVPFLTYVIAAGIAATSIALAYVVYRRFRDRVAYWV